MLFKLPSLRRWLGDSNCERAKFAVAVQVRLFSPTGFGIAKGLLVIKEDIDKIEIPTSMLKVGASLEDNPMHDNVVVVVSAIYPSDSCNGLARILSSGRLGARLEENIQPPSKTFTNVLIAKGKEGMEEAIKSCEHLQCVYS
jgi:hypothetical protein